MSEIVDEFLKSLKPNRDDFEQAVQLLLLCRGYLENHYKRSVYGDLQKGILDMLDEFIEGINDKR